jgi:hypothetical protein
MNIMAAKVTKILTRAGSSLTCVGVAEGYNRDTPHSLQKLEPRSFSKPQRGQITRAGGGAGVVKTLPQ